MPQRLLCTKLRPAITEHTRGRIKNMDVLQLIEGDSSHILYGNKLLRPGNLLDYYLGCVYFTFVSFAYRSSPP